MKLQGIGIVFALICLPIILVLSYYINLQIKTITLQTSYDSKLISATYSAMSAFELNTANEDLSSVSDSLRTIIEASDNIFMSNLATNLGLSNASKSYLEPYIPAILYTLYDGYYIYAPSYSPTVVTDSDGNAVSVGDIGVKKSGDKYDFNEIIKINSSTGNKEDPTETDINDNTDFENTGTDFGQLLYITDSTVKGTSATGGLSYTDCTTSIDPGVAKYKTQNILKTYIPYSARYVQQLTNVDGAPTADLNVIYTLDNYVTIEGTFEYADNRKIYYTKSGYLLPFVHNIDDTTGATTNSLSVRITLADGKNVFNYNQNDIQEAIERGEPIKVDVQKTLGVDDWETIIDITNINKAIIDKTNTNPNSDNAIVTRYENLVFDLQEILAVPVDVRDAQTLTDRLNSAYEAIEDKTGIDATNPVQIINALRLQINRRKYNMQLNSAAVYYAKAAIFSQWVAENLSDLKVNSIQDISGLNYTTYQEALVDEMSGNTNSHLDVWKDTSKVFNFTDGNDDCGSTEIRKDSSFYNHKLAIIRNSIQYNLNLAMSSYNKHVYYNDSETYKFDKNIDYAMPIMQEAEWEQIMNNVSIVSFMQGLECGLKVYSNYAVVSSSNNEIMTTPENIYYATVENFNDENSEYHKYNCNKMVEANKNLPEGTNPYNYISFTSKEVKYDKISTKSTSLRYAYDHKNLACYECINDGNYMGQNIFDTDNGEYSQFANLRKAYYIGVAKERNDIYKMNAVKKSEGYEILFSYDKGAVNLTSGKIDRTSILPLNKIKEIEIVFRGVNVERRDETSLTFKVTYGGYADQEQYSIPTNTTNYYTWNVKVNADGTSGNNNHIQKNNLIFTLQNPAETTSYEPGKIEEAIREIRIIYK